MIPRLQFSRWALGGIVLLGLGFLWCLGSVVYYGWFQIPRVGPGVSVQITSIAPRDVAKALRDAGAIRGSTHFKDTFFLIVEKDG